MNKDMEDNENKSDSIEEGEKANAVPIIDSQKSSKRKLTEFISEDKSSTRVSDEDIKNFAKSFSNSLRLIEDRIHSVNLIPAKSEAFVDIDGLFAEITVDLEDVQQYLKSSSGLLSEQKLNTCREIVDSLSQCCDEARKRLKPIGGIKKYVKIDLASGSSVQSTRRITQMLVQPPKPPRTSQKNLRRNPPRSPPPPAPPVPPPMPPPMRPPMPLKLASCRRKSRAQHISRKLAQRCRSPVIKKKIVEKTKEKTIDKTIEKTIDENTSLIRAHCSNVYIRFLRVDTKDKEVTMKFMSNCFIELQGKMQSLYIMEAYDSVFLCGSISGTLRMANCKNCTVFAVANQVNLNSTSFCGMFLYVSENTTIENCHHMDFGEYNYYYANSGDDTGDVSLNSTSNKYRNVVDYTTTQQFGSDAGGEPQRNWKFMSDTSIPDWNFMREKFKESVVERYNKPNLN